MIMYAMTSLVNSLAEIIGCEEVATNGKAVAAGWADNVDEETLEDWGRVGAGFGKEVERAVMATFKEEYKRLYLTVSLLVGAPACTEPPSQRFGLRTSQNDDVPDIIDAFLNILAMHELDFHASFRVLSSFRPSMVHDPAALDAFLAKLADCIPKKPTDTKRDDVKRAAKPWLQTYAERITQEQGSWTGGEDWEAQRCVEMRKVNPRFVLRQWVLEETIKKLEEGEGLERRRVLGHILKVCSPALALGLSLTDFGRQMATNPFEPYGGELAGPEEPLNAQTREEKRLCGFGAKEMLGFQCSCSS